MRRHVGAYMMTSCHMRLFLPCPCVHASCCLRQSYRPSPYYIHSLSAPSLRSSPRIVPRRLKVAAHHAWLPGGDRFTLVLLVASIPSTQYTTLGIPSFRSGSRTSQASTANGTEIMPLRCCYLEFNLSKKRDAIVFVMPTSSCAATRTANTKMCSVCGDGSCKTAAQFGLRRVA